VLNVHASTILLIVAVAQMVQQQALMASMVTQCPGNGLFNPTAPAMQGVAATQTHVAAAPSFSAPIITAASSGNTSRMPVTARTIH